MATVVLNKPDIALFADPGSTIIVIPHLIAAPRSRSFEQASVRFEGDDDVTTFRGEGRHRSHELVARFAADQHTDMLALVDLFETAHQAADGRLQLRTNFFNETPGLQPYEVVTVAKFAEQRAGGRVWDVRFTAESAAFTIEV